MERYICIHGHFYQPPRENPWLEAIELQDSAYPYHDWNERITAECYAANAAARMLDGYNKITDIVNNYARISFNFGPTLLAWLEEKRPDVYHAIQAADHISQENFSGHGSAIAQVYNHMILPLANRRDKISQIVWGIKDFEHRFGRFPEGMWLAETAVDLETLDILAEQGIKFTILAPGQATAVRPPDAGDDAWEDVLGARIDPSRAYLQRLPSGRSIALFFYDGPISQGIAFEGLLKNGADFANRLMGAFSDDRDWPQLVHIATDGETYGHHHHHGEMALAYALQYIKDSGQAELTNYGEFLEKHPPTWEVQITENTAWSCSHGVGRWSENCGCNSGGYPDWNQEWRGPLRAALDWLRDDLAVRYEETAKQLVKDPWQTRDAYINVILDRNPWNRETFLTEQATGKLTEEEQVLLWKLLEMQRHAMLMYTSCGWFFDELSGLETVQVIEYAGRAVQLALDIFGDESIEANFLERLAEANSNIGENGTGRDIYQKWIMPMVVDLPRVAMHYGVKSLFEGNGHATRIYSYSVEPQAIERMELGQPKLIVSRAKVRSEVTQEADDLTVAVVHLGGHNISGGVRRYRDDEEFEKLVADLRETFDQMDIPNIIRVIDQALDETKPLEATFRDEQRIVSNLILQPVMEEIEAANRSFYDRHAPLLRYLVDLNIPLQGGLKAVAVEALNQGLCDALGAAMPDQAHIQNLVDAAQRLKVPLDGVTLGFTLQQSVDAAMAQFQEQPRDTEAFDRVAMLLDLAQFLPFEVDLWQAQNVYFEMARQTLPVIQAYAPHNKRAQAWVDRFVALADKLWVYLPEGEVPGVNPDGRTIVGTVRILREVHSPQLDNTRDLFVYLPPSYETDEERRYPVVYMHDGQNLFDETASFAGEWHVDEAMQLLSWEGIEAIIVGVPNMGENRCEECSPYCDAKDGGGRGDDYLAFIVETVKPLVDAEFRTLPGHQYTGILGSSMGGLISLYAFVCYPQVFGFAGVLSPSLWFADRAIFKTVEETPFIRGKIYVDIGAEEEGAAATDARKMVKLLEQKGYRMGEDLMFVEETDADHNEAAWSRRLPRALRFLLPMGQAELAAVEQTR